MAKSKREENEEAGDYEFQLPPFDEKAFIRREVLGARASFVAVGIGLVGGILATVAYFLTGRDVALWYVGMLVVIATALAFPRVLRAMSFPEELTTLKATFGSIFMAFFTGLAVWMLGVNVL